MKKTEVLIKKIKDDFQGKGAYINIPNITDKISLKKFIFFFLSFFF